MKFPEAVSNKPNEEQLNGERRRWTVEKVEREYENVRARARSANIRRATQYLDIRQHDKTLDLPPYEALIKSRKFQRDGWKGFLGENFDGRQWTVEEVEREYENIKARVQSAKIHTSIHYREMSSLNNLKLPSARTLRKVSRFKQEGWKGFLGENYEGDSSHWTVEKVEREYENVRARARRANIPPATPNL